MNPARSFSSILWCASIAVVAVLLLPPQVRAQAEGVLVTRKGAHVKGSVQGSVVAIEEAAEIIVERGALVQGDLVVAGEKDAAGGHGKLKRSGQTKLTVVDASAVKGRERPSAKFSLPKAEKPRQPKGTEAVVVQAEKGADPDFARTKDLTLKNKKRELVLPPGAYGSLSVESGRVVLGRPQGEKMPRYYFQSLSVGQNGTLDLIGPAVVIVGQLGDIAGQLGNARFANWLDLRVESGAMLLAPGAEIFGVVTASESTVTLGPNARIFGGLICDRATVETNAVFTGVKPSWSKESSGNSLPRFIHKAARVESQMPELAERLGERYRARVEYPEDEPVLIVQEKGRTNDRMKQHRRHQAFFDACRTLFEGTGFARGMVLMIPAPGPAPAPPELLHVAMEREQFEDHLWAIGRQPDVRENIRVIRDDPLLLNLFMERSLKVARTSAAQGGAR